MEDNIKIESYEDLINRYKLQEGRLNEIEKLLSQLKYAIKPSLVKRRRQLKRIKEDIYDELCDYDDFATKTLTFDRKTVVKLMEAFYSYYFQTELKTIDLMDKKNRKYAVKASLIVSARDYEVLMKKFDFSRAVNSDEVIDCCNDEFIFLQGGKKCELYDGVYLNKAYHQFKEIDIVLERALTYKIKNNALTNLACLQMAFDDYVQSLRFQTVGYASDTYPLDEDLQREMSEVVQQVLDERKVGIGNSMLSMLDNMVTIEDKDEVPAQVLQQEQVSQQPIIIPLRRGQNVQEPIPYQAPAERQSLIEDVIVPAAPATPQVDQGSISAGSVLASMRREFQMAQQPQSEQVRMASVEERTPILSESSQTPVRVVIEEETPVTKHTQYKAASEVMLSMLDSMVLLDDTEKKLKK